MSRLLPGERIVWTGRPQQGIMFTGRDGLLIPFSLMWGGFAIFWEAGVLSIPAHGATANPAALIFPLWGVPFVLIGLYMIIGRFFHDAWIRSRTRYALTDRRALILQGSRLTTVDLRRIGTVDFKGRRRGTIVFGADQTFAFGQRQGFGLWLPSTATPPRFLGIENAQAVFNMVETARTSSAA
jgi:hypothetical protein